MNRLKLSGNALKILALISMTLDHVGLLLLHDYTPFRIIGRLAFPIFAYMIAEGCRYTRHKLKHFLMIFLLGLCCQVVLWKVNGSLHQGILMTFSLSILLIYALQFAKTHPKTMAVLPFLGLLAAVIVLCQVVPRFLPGTDYAFDYRLCGILLPVLIAMSDHRREQLILCALGLAVLCLYIGGRQWWSMLALIPIALYSGEKGKLPLKYLFYIYYPLHLAVIYGISMLMG
ncbi:MAG: TraX family protein [Eubacteriales bacterium]